MDTMVADMAINNLVVILDMLVILLAMVLALQFGLCYLSYLLL